MLLENDKSTTKHLMRDLEVKRARHLATMPIWRQLEGLEVLKRCKDTSNAQRDSDWCDFVNFSHAHPKEYYLAETATYKPSSEDYFMLEEQTTEEWHEELNETAKRMHAKMHKPRLPNSVKELVREKRRDDMWRNGIRKKGKEPSVLKRVPYSEPAAWKEWD